MRFLPALCVLLAAAIATTPSREAAADAPLGIAEGLSRVVKLYGAGGFQGLEAYGTGFLASPDGHVVTSWGPLLDAEPVTAVLDDGRRFTAKLVGVDPGLGLAVLRLNEADGALPFFDLAAAIDAAPGDRIFALSNMFRVAAGDEPVSAMHGVILAETPISARRGRAVVAFEEPVYLIDAVTNNPGAAGGVIVSNDGRLIGMIGRELRGEGTETWINYALPARLIQARYDAIVSGTEVADAAPPEENVRPTRRPVDWGIVTVPDVTARTPAYVTDVLSGSAAEAAGIRRDDLILFIGGRPTRSIREVTAALSRVESGDDVELVVRRADQLVPLKLAAP